ncbi:MAG: ribosome-binding factor A [Candidatus Taylorbacteria bacterium]|nr:ribosome-binding factor A [Candidatus Taylorbacteria bacterium]
MASDRDQKLKDVIKEAAAEFLQREGNYTSILTVTDISLSDRGNQATIFFTVLPEDKEKGALDFVKRKRADFREFFKNKARMRSLPFFDFEIDNGEKNRQKIDEIARNVVQ